MNWLEKKQAKTQASQDLRSKLRLEATFKPELRSLFSTIVNDFKEQFAALGAAIDARSYESQWKSILQNHYKRVQKVFNGTVKNCPINLQYKQETQEDTFSEELLALSLLVYRATQSTEQAEIISRTNDAQVNEAISEARAALEEEGKPTDNRSLAATAGAILARKFKGRVDTIALTETQGAAENAKFGEAMVATGRIPPGVTQPLEGVAPQPTEATKAWQTMGDKDVRPTHKAANGQTQPIDAPFQVGDSLLMYPRDTSMGASVKEIVNCRCSAVYKF
ncbi:MAG: hypothetical protein GY820_17255 [Gammaproteobacteria bacterium]|nr:hypothetical protein [Gammaproteobacteria bacterium]